MSVTIDGNNGITSPDFEPSSSTTPTNGLFLPAANTVGLATGSTERLRIDSSGNLGLGVTPSAWGSGRKVIEVGGSSGNSYLAFNNAVNLQGYIYWNAYYNNADINVYKKSDLAGVYGFNSSGQFVWLNAPSGTAGAAISFTQTMTLDASGRLGIGDTSPFVGLSVVKYGTAWNSDLAYPKPAGNVFIFMKGESGQDNWFGLGGRYGASTGSANLLLQANYNNAGQAAGHYIASEATGVTASVLTFGRMIGGGTTGTPATKSEAARIDSSGNLLVGTTTTSPGGIVASKSTTAGTQCFGAWNAVDAGNAYLFYGGTGSASFTARYQIYWNFTSGTGTAGFISDYRQKDNVRKLANGLDAIKALKPSTYRFKDALEDASGFIAHEVQEVIPQAVSGHKDEVDEDGNPKYQMLDQTHIIPYLTAAIQELTTRLEILENK